MFCLRLEAQDVDVLWEESENIFFIMLFVLHSNIHICNRDLNFCMNLAHLDFHQNMIS